MTNNEILLKYLPFIEDLFARWKVNEDCQQMIYLDFLSYDNSKLNKLDESEQMNFWLVRFIKNYWFSKNSRYYYTYVVATKNWTNTNEYTEQCEEDEWD